MHPKIKKALDYLQEANYSGYFDQMDDIVPHSLKTVYQEHKGIFIAGQKPWNFYQILETFAKEVDKIVSNAASTTNQNTKQIDLKSLYNTLNQKLNDESLTLFCQLNFEEVHNNFTAGQSKIAKISALLDYAKRKDLYGKLEQDLRDFLI